MAKFVPAEPFDIVIFGGTGDLARRKLLPALYHRDLDGQLSPDSRIIGVSRRELSDDEFAGFVRESLEQHLKEGEFQAETWERFATRLHYRGLDVETPDGWTGLAEMLDGPEERVRVYYMATSPSLFGPVAEQLARSGLVHERSRIVLEKPVGQDLASATAINDAVGAVFDEEQIFRIDHFLGKETVQNLLAIRFGNSIFARLWECSAIDHVQITVAESLGVGTRGDFYDRTGALRDMVQNHLLQLLCLVAMEPVRSLNHHEIRDEKLKVLRALRPITAADVKRETVRGQYRAGAVDGQAVPAYVEELEQGTASNRETFVALKAQIDNWRWANTPFYLRTGKRLPMKSSEIVIQFAPVAHRIFPEASGELTPNQLVIRLQPNEGVMLSLMSKEPGPGGFEMHSLPLNLSFNEAFDLRYPDAYERLLMEVIRGNPALFMRRDEVEAAWSWIDGIVDGWEQARLPVQTYPAGTWGPPQSLVLLDRDGRSWCDPV